MYFNYLKCWKVRAQIESILFLYIIGIKSYKNNTDQGWTQGRHLRGAWGRRPPRKKKTRKKEEKREKGKKKERKEGTMNSIKLLHNNPLRPTVIQKLLEIIDRVRLYPSCSFATALDSDINQTTGSGGHLSMWENRCMHAAVCLLRAGQPRSAGDAAKSGQFVGQFSWVTGDPIGLKGLYSE